MLTSRLVRQFIAVAEELNFHRAAQRLHMAQSPLSQAMRHLEDLMRTQLLTRTNRGVSLSAAGKVLLTEARALLAYEERAISRTRFAAGAAQGKLAIGYIGSLAFETLPEILRRFRAVHPDIRLDMHELSSTDQLEALLRGRLDLGLVRLPLEQAGEDICVRSLRRHYLVAALPAGHALAARNTTDLDLASLSNDAFVMFAREPLPSMHLKVVGACIDAGFYPSIAFEVSEISSAIGLVASGMAVALLPSCVQVMQHPGVVFKRLAGASGNIILETALAWRKSDTTPALQEFLMSTTSDDGVLLPS